MRGNPLPPPSSRTARPSTSARSGRAVTSPRVATKSFAMRSAVAAFARAALSAAWHGSQEASFRTSRTGRSACLACSKSVEDHVPGSPAEAGASAWAEAAARHETARAAPASTALDTIVTPCMIARSQDDARVPRANLSNGL